MILRMRGWSRAIAVLLVCAALPGLSHLAEDDAACLSAFEAFTPHDHGRHAFRSGEPPHQDHCAICHWSRSLRTPRSVATAWAGPVRISDPVAPAADSPHLPPALEHTPARAPPAASDITRTHPH
jgi:hypothetical protein